MNQMIPAQFDYAGNGIVDSELVDKLNTLSQRGIAVFTKTSIQMTAIVGELLSEAQELLSSHNNKEGVFCKWATCTFGLSKSQVYRILNAWDKYLCSGTERFSNWTQGAIYYIAQHDVPKGVLKKVERLVPSDGMVREADIAMLYEEHVKAVMEAEDNSDVPFGEADVEKTPAQLKLEAKLRKQEEQKAAREKKAAEAKAKKAEQAKEREKQKALKKKEQEAAKKAAKEAKAKEREEAKKRAAEERRKAMTPAEQLAADRDVVKQLLGKAITNIANLHELKKSPPFDAARAKKLQSLLNSGGNKPCRDVFTSIVNFVLRELW